MVAGPDVAAIVAAYDAATRWERRAELLVAATRISRGSDAAVALGVHALGDRARIVRYRACGLLAYALRRDSLPALRELLTHPDEDTRGHAAAAIDAIEHGSHHRFIDRTGSGRTFWEVNPGDVPPDGEEPSRLERTRDWLQRALGLG